MINKYILIWFWHLRKYISSEQFERILVHDAIRPDSKWEPIEVSEWIFDRDVQNFEKNHIIEPYAHKITLDVCLMMARNMVRMCGKF